MKAPARDRILKTASQLFFKRGYKEVGINEIIEKSETAKASFYANFKSKEELGEAWLKAVHERSVIEHSTLLTDLSNPLKVLQGYFKALEKHLKEESFRGCPYTNTAAVLTYEETTLHALVHEHKTYIRQFFRKLANHALADSKKARTLGDQIFLLYSGAATESQNLQSLWPVELALKASKNLWREATHS